MSPASQGAREVERYIGSCLITSSNGGRSSLQNSFNNCRKHEISSQTLKQQQQQYLSYDTQQCQKQSVGQFGGEVTWAGGAPLINISSNSRRMNNNNNNQRSSPIGQKQLIMNNNNQQLMINEQQQHHIQNRVPLARLAVHTQGAPLVLSSNRYQNNNHNNKIYNGQSASGIANYGSGLITNNINNNSNGPKCYQQLRTNNLNNKSTANEQKKSTMTGKTVDVIGVNTKDGTTATSIDSLSIASDESSGSNNSENNLPRIIKPRKRRKKDRKPPMLANTVDTNILDVKSVDETAKNTTHTSPTSSSSSSISAMSEQQPLSKPYQTNSNNSYDTNRYTGDNYYNRGPRRSVNSGYARHNVNVSSNSTHTIGNIVPKPQQEVIDTRQQQQQQQQQIVGSNGYTTTERRTQVKVLHDNRNVILPVPVCQQTTKANYMRQQQQQRFISEQCNNVSEPVKIAHHQELGNSTTTEICCNNNNNSSDDCLIQSSNSHCQCRYNGDPATLIWDVSGQYLTTSGTDLCQQRYHHHHHHHHHHRYSQIPATVFLARPVICQDHPNAIDLIDVTDNPCLRLRTTSNGTATIQERNTDGTAMLRRSWSDPTSYFSDDLVPNRDVGVIGDRGCHNDTNKGRNTWRADVSTSLENSLANSRSSSISSSLSTSTNSSPNASPCLQGPLEVSTEIVTSANGHRDLEIKFYSSSPTSYYSSSSLISNVKEPVKLTSALNCFVNDDDGSNDSEEFSDIWSYHESKLQQDFRTLLQAE